MTGPRSHSPTHRTTTGDPQPRRAPSLPVTLAFGALFPALVWVATHLALVVTAVAAAAVTVVAVALARRLARRTGLPATLTE